MAGRGSGRGRGGVAATARLRRRRLPVALFLLPFLVLFSSTRIYCENCRYESIPGLSRADGGAAPSVAAAESCCARARATAKGPPADGAAPDGTVRHKRSPVCIAKHLPLQEGAEAPAAAPTLARFAGSDARPLPALHEAETSFPRASRAPPA